MSRLSLRALAGGVAFLVHTGIAGSQNTPVSFLHGFQAHPGWWYSTATNLQAQLQISAFLPFLSSIETYQTQAAEAAPYAVSNGILVGHSNGGVVSRLLAQRGSVKGFVTLGSPNQGMPLQQTWIDLWAFLIFTVNDLGMWINDAFWWTPQWVQSLVQQGVEIASVYVLELANHALYSFGMLGNPINAQMAPNSAFFYYLNSTDSLAAEDANTDEMVSITAVPADHFTHAALRLLYAGGNAEGWGSVGDVRGMQVDIAAWDLWSIADNIDMYGDIFNWEEQQFGDRSRMLALDLMAIDWAWCASVNGDLGPVCQPNDTFVPAWSQDLNVGQGPRGSELSWSPGPLHNDQPFLASAFLSNVLRFRFNVQPR